MFPRHNVLSHHVIRQSRQFSLARLHKQWRPKPLHTTDAQFHEVYSLEQRRRGSAGFVIALGISSINAYLWYEWRIASSAASRGDAKNMQFMLNNFTSSLRNYEQGRWWCLVSAGFSHIEAWHILANTLGVISFFPVVSMSFGAIPTLVGYLGCITAGSAASLWYEKNKTVTKENYFDRYSLKKAEPESAGLGASAGVFGLFTFSMLLNPTSSVAVFFIPFPAWFAWGCLTGIDLYCALFPIGRQKMSQVVGTNVGHEAHLGGSGFALLSTILLYRLRRR